MNILVAGGAGYVGSHTCLALSKAGFNPIVYDNLTNGHSSFVKWGPLIEGDIRDTDKLKKVMKEYEPVGIIHFAAWIEVGDSTKHPLAFFENNVAGTISLLQAAQECGIKNIVFSSTCATYGDPTKIPISENHVQKPINPYGRSKLIVEEILRDLDKYTEIKSVCLRYFNAAGADQEAGIGEAHDPETHIIPLAIDVALGRREVFSIFGTDYDTRDGTCVRDYVHVNDLADAHVRSVRYLLDGGASDAFNLGTGQGATIKELINILEKTINRKVNTKQAPRRAGDPSVLLADNSKAEKVLGWKPQYDLQSIIQSAWNWHSLSNT